MKGGHAMLIGCALILAGLCIALGFGMAGFDPRPVALALVAAGGSFGLAGSLWQPKQHTTVYDVIRKYEGKSW